jgi:quinol monooxygenase YgiN
MENNRIEFRSEFIVEDGKKEECKKLILEMSRMVEVNEPDTLTYQIYFDISETKCIVHEAYRNSEAAIAHAANMPREPYCQRFFSLSKVSRVEIYGKPSDEVQKALTSFNPQTYNLFTGFSR